MDKLDDFLRYSTLFLYYGELFSKKQKQYLELYLEEDRSLSEISEEYGITRQAVFDNIKRGFKQLEEYESKLKIFEKEKELKKRLENLKSNFTKENLEKKFPRYFFNFPDKNREEYLIERVKLNDKDFPLTITNGKIEEFEKRGKISTTLIKEMRLLNMFDGMDESSQLSLF